MRHAPLLILLLSCKNNEAPPPPPSPPKPRVEPPPAPEEPGTIKTTSEIGELHGDTLTTAGNALPPAEHGHGEALRGAWVAPDGTEFLAGYMYTGVPGPDTGVVYRKDRDRGWKIAYSKRENELGHLWGTSASDVWASGVTTLVHWDGTAWREEQPPKVAGYLTGIWGNGHELFVVGGNTTGIIYRRDAKGAWTVDGHSDHMLYGIAGAGDTVVAVGDHGTILRRVAGKWHSEGTGDVQHTSVWAANEHDIYVAGSRKLLHSTGDGAWHEIELGTAAQTIAVWGRSATDVYIGTLGGLIHWDGAHATPTAWKHDVETVAGNADVVLVANQHM